MNTNYDSAEIVRRLRFLYDRFAGSGLASHPASGVVVLSLSLIGCGGPTEVTTEGTGQTVYVDTETMQAMVSATSEEAPAVNPITGKRTLMPALYCPKCRLWHAVPAPDHINRVPGATTCRETGATLTADGPWPR